MTTMHTAQRHPGRRLSDAILRAFHQACDQSNFSVAETLLVAAAAAIEGRRAAGLPDRREKESLVEAYRRLWHLKRNSESLRVH